MTLCPISPDGLSELRQLPHLRYLNISASPLTAAHVTELAQTPLQELIAGATNLDNEQAARLAQMRSLNRLHLVGNQQITDELLTTLSQCDWLKQIELSLTGVSAAGVEKLKQTLPKCKVTWQEK